MSTVTDPGDVRDDTAADSRHGLHPDGAPLSSDDSKTLQHMDDSLSDPNDPSNAPESSSSGSGGGSSKSSSSKSSHKSASAASGGSASSTSTAGGGIRGKASAAASSIGNNRKKYLAGGGVLGLILALVIAFISILPLKLESMMKNVFEKRVGNRVESYIETRGQALIERYLVSSVGESDATFERNIVTMGNPVKDLFRTYRLNKFEQKLSDHQGVRFQRGASGGVDVYKDGEFAGNLGNSEARAVVNKAVKDETKWFQVYQRRHLRAYLRNALHITKWKFFDKAEGKQAQDTVDNELMTDANPEVASEVADVFGCATAATNCAEDPMNPEEVEQGTTLVSDPAPTAADTTQDGTTTDAANQANADALQGAEDQAAKDGGVKSSKILTKILGEKIATSISQLFAAAKGPLIVIAAIDIASRIDHFIYPGTADKIILGAHEMQYASQFTEWLTIASDWKNGNNVSGDEFNDVMVKLEGIEQSSAFQDDFLGESSGQPLTTVGDGNGGTTQDGTRSINESSHPIQAWYQSHIGNIPVPPPSVHAVLNLWYLTGGKVMNIINSVVGGITSLVLSAIEAIFPPIQWLMSNIGTLLGQIMTMLIRPAVDGTEIGADLMNGIDAGGAVTGMEFARDLGAPHISLADANQLDENIALEQSSDARSMSLATRLFSPDYSHSLVNSLAIAVPSTPQGAVNESTDYLASIAINPIKTLAPFLAIFGLGSAHAAALDSPQSNYGLIDWGYSAAQLASPIDDADLDKAYANAATRLGHTPTFGEMVLADCPDVPDPTTQPNLCRLDLTTLQAMGSTSDSTDDGGINGATE